MRHTWFSVLLVSLVAAAVSFAVARRTLPAQAPRLEALQDVDWLKKTLQLTPGQVKDIGGLQPEFKRAMDACCDRHCRARGQLFGTLLSSTDGVAAARGYVEQMCRAQADSELATLEHIQRVYTLLAPEQQAIYRAQLKAMTCSHCPACASPTCGRAAQGLP